MKKPNVIYNKPAFPFTAEVKNRSEYYPFGWEINLTNSIYNSYRYSYNGTHLKDNEISGNGNHFDFGGYGLDPRIGRRWNLDPVLHEWQSDYSVFANNPIVFADPSGLDCVCGGDGNGDSVNPGCNGDKEETNDEEIIDDNSADDNKLRVVLPNWDDLSEKDKALLKESQDKSTKDFFESLKNHGEVKYISDLNLNNQIKQTPKNITLVEPTFLGMTLGEWERSIPVWGPCRLASDEFWKGNYAGWLFYWGLGLLDAITLGDAFKAYQASKLASSILLASTTKIAISSEEKIIVEIVPKEGIYELITPIGKYIGQSKDIMGRITQHFTKVTSPLFTTYPLAQKFYAMPGSTKLEREVYEQYLIIISGGKNSLINKYDPLGGRKLLYEQMIDEVITKYNLPRF